VQEHKRCHPFIIDRCREFDYPVVRFDQCTRHRSRDRRMARTPRTETLDDTEVGVYHCINRCVRRAFLCGVDPLTGKDFEHRKDLIRRRLQFLAGRFGLDVLSYTVMSNHIHVILRNRPDVVADWSDDEVARRWWELFPARRERDGSPAEPNESDLAMITSDPEILKERRRRLSNVSWFMRCLCESIARLANKEEDCTGRFWEGRFKCQRLLDEAAILACSVYVDLNPIRAKVAKTPETSRFTSAHDRIEGSRQPAQPRRVSRREKHRAATSPKGSKTRSSPSTPDGWLSRLELAKENPTSKTQPVERASDKGFLPLNQTQYFQLLDWTGRQVRQDKRGVIPKELSPILQRIGVSSDSWIDTVVNFGRWFRRAAGRVESVANEANKHGRRWLHGVSHCRAAFS